MVDVKETKDQLKRHSVKLAPGAAAPFETSNLAPGFFSIVFVHDWRYLNCRGANQISTSRSSQTIGVPFCAMVLLGPLLTFLTTLALFGQAQEDPPCVDLLQLQLHLDGPDELDDLDVDKDDSDWPHPSPALNVNVLSYQLWQGSVQILGELEGVIIKPGSYDVFF